MVHDDLYYKAYDLVEELKACDVKVAFAESLTGGMISSRLVDIEGASEVFNGSVVSYTNDVKRDILGVKADTIEAYTEVSEECAKEMALNVRNMMKADISVSATGYAGGYDNANDYPDPDDEDDLTGTVWFGFSTEDETFAVTQYFVGARDSVRLQAVEFAFNLILEYLKENYE
ncbi:MAG: CinA family protein [Clostridiales bacterium]|nr:CinA family protein [Clostridiales bacterium]